MRVTASPSMSLPAQPISTPSDLTERNKAAWDQLYRSTPQHIWGSQPVGFLAECLADLPPVTPDERVLDAAAGEGRNLGLLRRLGGRLHACDASAHALAKIPPDQRADVVLTTCDVRALPFPDEHFRVVLLSDVMETLPDPDAVVAEINRVLVPGGALLCNIPGHDDGIAGIDMQPVGGGAYLYRGSYYYRFFDPTEATTLLERNGLHVSRVRLCQWREDAHPEFRPDGHLHVSRVFLALKSSS